MQVEEEAGESVGFLDKKVPALIIGPIFYIHIKKKKKKPTFSLINQAIGIF